MEKKKPKLDSCEMIVPSLTKEQKALLESLEEEFKGRYTEEDEDFKATLERKPQPPPIVENWFRIYDKNARYDDDNRDRNSYRQRHSHENYENYRGYRRDDDEEYRRRPDRFSYPHHHRRFQPS